MHRTRSLSLWFSALVALALVADHARAQSVNKAIEKDSNGNLTASYATGNRTLTIASGGTLSAVAGSNVILAGTTTLSGNITSNGTLTGGTLANITLTGNVTSNATVTHSGALTLTGNTALGNTTVADGRTLTLANVSGNGYSYPLQWGGGSKYSLAGGTSTFNSVEDYNGGIQYNHARASGDVAFVLGFEHRYQNNPQGVDTEFYYNWDKPVGSTTDAGGVASRRVFQTNVSWGSTYSAPVDKPTGYAQWSFDVNKFTVDNGSNFNGDFLLDFTSSPKRMTWNYATTLNGALTLGGAITQTGANTNALSGATTITGSNAAYVFTSSATDALATLNNASGDAGTRYIRGSATGEHITIGAAAGGGIFGTLSNAFAIQRTGNTTIRDLYFRRYDGTTYTQDGRLTPSGLWILGTGSDDTVNRLQVYGSALFTADNGNTLHLLNSALGAGNAGLWFNAATPSGTNFGISGSGTNTILNSPNGSILFRNANVTRATLSSTGISFDATTEATTGGAGSIVTAGGIYSAKAVVSGSTTASTSTTTGSIITGGGLGVAGAGYFGGLVNAGGGTLNIAHTGNNPTLRFLQTSTETWTFQSFSSDLYVSGSVTGKSLFIRDGASSPTLTFRPDTGVITFAGTTDATTGGAGQLVTSGGIYAAKKIVTSSDVEVADIGEGIIIKSPNGTRWRITVSDAGAFVATSL